MSIKKILKKLFVPEVDQFTLSEKKKKAVTENKKIEFPELNEAWEFFLSEKFDNAREVSEKYSEDENLKLQFEAKKIIALTYFRQGQYVKSERIFENLSINSTNSEDWFNLVISLTHNSKFSKSEKAFSKALKLSEKNKNHQNLSIPNMRFYYMQSLKDMKQFDLAFNQLIELSKIYTKLTITDGTFLYMRGVPFFENTVDSSKEILENIAPSKSEYWISSMKKGIDQYGVKYLAEFENKINYAS